MTHERKRTHDRSWLTGDRGPPSSPDNPSSRGAMLTVEQIGPRQELMRNGNLVCYEVPIARLGWMLYGPGEVPVVTNPTSPSIYVERTDDELFSPDTIASFFGVAIVNDHPDFGLYPEGVTPDNFRELAGGYAVNPRRGRDGDEDVLLADLIITRRDLIEAVRKGKREVSAGYSADYKTVRPGIGRQTNILANHIALVEKGRCGPRCAIGDHAPQPPQEHSMPKPQESGASSAPRRHIDASTLDSMQEFIDGQRRTGEEDEDSSHIHIHVTSGVPTADKKTADDDPAEQRFGALEKGIGELGQKLSTLGAAVDSYFSGKPKTKDGEPETEEAKTARLAKETKDAEIAAAADKEKAEMTGDSVALATSWQELQSKAEILMPGFKMPTFDSAQPRKLTVDSMCKVRGRVLDLMVATEEGAAMISALTGDAAPDIEGMDCQAKALLFSSAAAYKAKANNTAATADAGRIAQSADGGVRAISNAEMNARNQKFWDKLQNRGSSPTA